MITSLLVVVRMLLLELAFLSVALSESLIAANSVQRREAFYLAEAMGVKEIVPPIPDLFYNPINPDVISHQLIEGQVSGESVAVQAAKLYYQANLRIVNGVATLKSGTSVDVFFSCVRRNGSVCV